MYGPLLSLMHFFEHLARIGEESWRAVNLCTLEEFDRWCLCAAHRCILEHLVVFFFWQFTPAEVLKGTKVATAAHSYTAYSGVATPTVSPLFAFTLLSNSNFE